VRVALPLFVKWCVGISVLGNFSPEVRMTLQEVLSQDLCRECRFEVHDADDGFFSVFQLFMHWQLMEVRHAIFGGANQRLNWLSGLSQHF